MMSRQKGVLVAVLLASKSAAAYRPFDGTDADVVEYHEVELEVGPVEYLREDSETALIVPSVVANYGFSPDWEFVLEGAHAVVLEDDARRFRLVEPGTFLKTVLRRGSLQGGGGLSVATEFGLLLPEIGNQSGAGGVLTAVLSRQWPALTLHVNIENAFTREHHYEPVLGCITEGPSFWRVRPVSEIFVSRQFGELSLAHGLTESALVGLIWRVEPDLSIDMAERIDFEGERPHAEEIRGGFTWAFGSVP